MIIKEKYSKMRVPFALLTALCMILVPMIAGEAYATDSYQMQLVGHSDLQGRNSLQVTLKGNYAYVGHHRGQEWNPMTQAMEHNGTTIVDVSNPKKPVIIKHIPGADFAESRAVQVVYDHLGTGEDYLIRNQEIQGGRAYFEIFNITDKANPFWVSEIAEVIPGGGNDLTLAHKGWWYENKTEGVSYYFGSANDTIEGKPGNQHLIIWDLTDPGNPLYVSSGWIPGQKIGEPVPGEPRMSLHHPVVDWDNRRIYGAFLFGGDVVVWDISTIANPTVIFHIDYNPPYPDPGPHTSIPFFGVKTPNFTPGFGQMRDYILVSDEGFGGDTAAGVCQDVRNHLFSIDVTDFEHPVTVAAFKIPDGDFCERGLSVRPHQFVDTQDDELYSIKDNNNLIYVAYFSKGLRLIDYSDPYNPKEVAHFLPQTTNMTKTKANGVTTILTNDVDLDYRGLAYTTDRAGTGLHIIKYLGN